MSDAVDGEGVGPASAIRLTPRALAELGTRLDELGESLPLEDRVMVATAFSLAGSALREGYVEFERAQPDGAELADYAHRPAVDVGVPVARVSAVTGDLEVAIPDAFMAGFDGPPEPQM